MNHYYPGNHHGVCMCGACESIFKRANPQTITKPYYAGGYMSCDCLGCNDRYRAGKQGMAKSDIAITIGDRSMSTLNMCEREGCETLIKGKALGAVTLIYTTDQQDSMSRDGSNVKRLELCPACVEDIHNVIMYAPITKRDKGYSKPFDPRVTEVETDLANVDTEHMMAVLMQRVMQTKSIESGDNE